MVKVHDVARMKNVVDIEGGLFGGNSFSFPFSFIFSILVLIYSVCYTPCLLTY